MPAVAGIAIELIDEPELEQLIGLHRHLPPLVGLVEGDASGPRGTEIKQLFQKTRSAEDLVAAISRNAVVDLSTVSNIHPQILERRFVGRPERGPSGTYERFRFTLAASRLGT